MEAATLARIEALALAASGHRVAGTHIPVALVPQGVGMHSLEPFMENRLRFRGTLDTTSLKDFAAHVIARNATGASGFVSADDTQSLGCTVIFNIGNATIPGHCDDIAKLALKPTAAFEAVHGITNKKPDQKDLAEWMEDWSTNLHAKDADGGDISLSRAVAAIRKVTIETLNKAEHQVGDMAASRSAMDSIAATSTEVLPATLEFTATPFEGLQARTMVLRVGVLTGSAKPVFSLRWVQKNAQLEEIASEFKDILKAEIGGMATLIMGSFSAGK